MDRGQAELLQQKNRFWENNYAKAATTVTHFGLRTLDVHYHTSRADRQRTERQTQFALIDIGGSQSGAY